LLYAEVVCNDFLAIGFISNKCFALYDAPLWAMALIASRLHWVWIGAVCVRLEMRFSYSNTLGWNTFPVPTLTDKNKMDLTCCAEDILLAQVGEPLHHAPFGGGEVLWAAVSCVLAISVILLAARWVGSRRTVPATESPEATGFGRVLLDKWYVDEAYDAIVVRPVLALSRGFAKFIDQGLIDGIANGLGYASRAFGWVGSRLQTGQINTYAFAVVAGTLLLLAFMVL